MEQSMDADVIVIGLGAMGAATFYQIAKRGGRVIGVDRFTPPHPYGSSHGRYTHNAAGRRRRAGMRAIGDAFARNS